MGELNFLEIAGLSFLVIVIPWLIIVFQKPPKNHTRSWIVGGIVIAGLFIGLYKLLVLLGMSGSEVITSDECYSFAMDIVFISLLCGSFLPDSS